MSVNRRQLLQFAPLALLGAASPQSLSAAPKSRAVWSGKSGGFDWRWTKQDVIATRAGQRVLSLRQRLPQEREGYGAFERTATPLSVVGSLLCYRVNDFWTGGAHPSGWIWYAAVDAARPSKPVTLTDLFPDAAVRDALWSDRIVRGALTKAGVKAKPATAKALAKLLDGKHFDGKDEDGKPVEEMYRFSEGLLGEFAFHHVEGNQVAVRLCAAWGAEIFRFQYTEIGILLPIPPKLREPLQRAATQREGFLRRYSSRAFQEQGALLVNYEEKPEPRGK